MPFDGAFLYKIKNEISTVSGAHIEKIYQPSRDELVFLLRSKEGAFRLFISAKPGSSRIHFTNEKFENPSVPPMFCMLLRKYLGAARLYSVEQNGLERVITLNFTSLNEMGDVIYPKIICELIGSQPNIIFADGDNVIYDCIRRSDFDSSTRLLQPGARYTPPISTEKLDILTEKTDEITKAILSKTELPLWKAILDTIGGISPLIARELSLNVCGDFEKIISDLSEGEKMNIQGSINFLVRAIVKEGTPTVLNDNSNVPKDFSFIPINQYGGSFSSKTYTTYGEALDAFYKEKDNADRIKRASNDILKLLSNLIARTEKKMALRRQDLIACADREKYRIYGELIKANLFKIPQGSSFALLQNYYDENLAEIKIPLDPAFSPAANADRYFKEYKKSYTAEKMLNNLIKQDEEDLKYFDSVFYSLTRAETIAELNEIRSELIESGILRIERKVKKSKDDISFREYLSPSGFKILIGKHNRQNDLLTLSKATKGDLWFHAKNIPGSHTVLITEGNTVPEEDILFAAKLAAKYSKAQSSSNVPVDYTLIKFVKKPSGAKPGMVIYSGEKTLFVSPDISDLT